jgi:plasmid stabilization system protein ParE
MRVLTESAEAQREVAQLALHIADRGQRQAAVRLLDAYHDLCVSLLGFPERGPLAGFGAADVRRIRVAKVKSYAVRVFYTATTEEIRVLAVVHASRSDAYVTRRLLGGE